MLHCLLESIFALSKSNWELAKMLQRCSICQSNWIPCFFAGWEAFLPYPKATGSWQKWSKDALFVNPIESHASLPAGKHFALSKSNWELAKMLQRYSICKSNWFPCFFACWEAFLPYPKATWSWRKCSKDAIFVNPIEFHASLPAGKHFCLIQNQLGVGKNAP